MVSARTRSTISLVMILKIKCKKLTPKHFLDEITGSLCGCLKYNQRIWFVGEVEGERMPETDLFSLMV